MRLLCAGLLCLFLCGCFLSPAQQPAQTLQEPQQIVIEQVDFSDREPKDSRIGWPLTICIAACMFLMPIIMTKGRKL